MRWKYWWLCLSSVSKWRNLSRLSKRLHAGTKLNQSPGIGRFPSPMPESNFSWVNHYESYLIISTESWKNDAISESYIIKSMSSKIIKQIHTRDGVLERFKENFYFALYRHHVIVEYHFFIWQIQQSVSFHIRYNLWYMTHVLCEIISKTLKEFKQDLSQILSQPVLNAIFFPLE